MKESEIRQRHVLLAMVSKMEKGETLLKSLEVIRVFEVFQQVNEAMRGRRTEQQLPV
jgi:hypothetical protein